jgi:hypothetical protein
MDLLIWLVFCVPNIIIALLYFFSKIANYTNLLKILSLCNLLFYVFILERTLSLNIVVKQLWIRHVEWLNLCSMTHMLFYQEQISN